MQRIEKHVAHHGSVKVAAGGLAKFNFLHSDQVRAATTLSLVTDSKKKGSQDRRSMGLLFIRCFKAASRHMPVIANTIMKIDSFIKKAKRKICRQ